MLKLLEELFKLNSLLEKSRSSKLAVVILNVSVLNEIF